MFKSIISLLRKKQISPVENYLQNGNVILGANSDISKLKVTIFGAEKNVVNVKIGDDCMLEGSLVLYNSKSKIIIGDRCFIGGGSSLLSFSSILLGDDVMISWGCTVIDTNAHSLQSDLRVNDVLDWKKGWQYKNWENVISAPIEISRKCWIGFNSIILKGTILDEGCIVAAGSVVVNSFESYSVIGGNPAKTIKRTI